MTTSPMAINPTAGMSHPASNSSEKRPSQTALTNALVAPIASGRGTGWRFERSVRGNKNAAAAKAAMAMLAIP